MTYFTRCFVLFGVFALKTFAEIVVYDPNNLPTGPNPPVDTPYTAWTSGSPHYNASLHSDTLHSWGPKTMMFVYVRPTDGNVPAMKTHAQLQAELDNTSQFYFDESFRRAWFGTKVINPGQANQHIVPRLEVVYVQLPNNVAYYSGNNNFGRLTSDTFNAVRGLGGEYAAGQRLDPNNFDRIQIFGDPKLITSTGLANVRGRYSWSGNTLSGGVVRHELGHNWGVFHANNWVGADGIPRNGVGTHQEYMDGADVMGGGGGSTGFNTMFKHRLHFLHELSGDVAVADSSGEYRIFAHTNPESNRPETRERGVLVPVTGTTRFFKNIFLGFRHTNTPGGGMSRNSWDRHAVTVHANNTSNSGNNGGSHLIDTSPGSWAADDRVDAAIKIGRTYSEGPNVNGTHIYGGMHITALGTGSIEASGFTHHYIDVRLNYGMFPGNQAPEASFSETLITGAIPGQPFTLTVNASDPDGDDLAFDWSFGDNGYNTVSSASQTRTWSQPGVYLVSCTVSDMKGGATTAQTWVNVGNVAFQDPAPPAASLGGITYRYYHGSWSSLPDFDNFLPVKEGTVSSFTLAPRERDTQYGFVYEGFIEVPASDVYSFHVRARDGARLHIGGAVVVNNDGLKSSPADLSGNIALNAGKHPFRLEFFHASGGGVLEVDWSTLAQARAPVPPSALARTDWAGNDAPQVAITTPLPGEEILVGSDILLSADASDSDGIASVKFYGNGVLIGQTAAAPHQTIWENVSVGPKTVVAVATDSTGQSTTSAPLHFTVASPPPTRVVGINFAGSNSHAIPYAPNPLDFSDRAGAVYAERHWNNFTRLHDFTNGPVYTDLIDNAGLPTPIHTIGSGHIHNTDGISNADTDSANGRMMKGNIYVNGGQASPWLTVNDIHFAQYDVYVYFDYKDNDSSDAAIRRFDITTADGATFLAPSKFGRNSLSHSNGVGDYPNYDMWVGFKESTATSASAPNSEVLGNYVVFRNITGPEFRLVVHDSTGGVTGKRFMNGVQIVEVPATIPQVRLLPPANGWQVAEGGPGSSYSVVLATAPTDNVTVNINPGPQLNVNPSSLVFTPSNWNVPRPVTLTAVDDTAVEGPHTGTLAHTVSAAGSYAGVTVPPVTVQIADNDQPTVSVTAHGRLLENNPQTASFLFTRSNAASFAQPLTVHFQMSGAAGFSGDYTLSGASVNFNTTTGAGSVVIPAGQSQISLTVAAVNDSAREYGEDARLTLTASPDYAIGQGEAWIFIEDDDAGDYLVEIFNSASYQNRPFSLNNKSVTFVPDGAARYRVYTDDISGYPSGTSGFTTFNKSATASGQATASWWTLPLAQPFTFFGVSYGTVYVNTEGSLTFGQGVGDYGNSTGWSDNMFRDGYPRIAPLFGRFSIDVSGNVRHRRVEEGADSRTVIFYDTVRVYNAGGANVSFQVELFDDGRIRFSYGNFTYTQISHIGIATGVDATMPTRPFQTTTEPKPFYQSDFRLYPPSPPSAPAPFFVSQPVLTGTAGSAYNATLTVAHPLPGRSVTITAPTLPAWLTLTDHGNGSATLSGTPPASGSFQMLLQVSDGTNSSQQAFTLTVDPSGGNTPPVFTSAPVTEAVGLEAYSHIVTATDADGHALTFSIVTAPGWLTLANHGDGTATLSGSTPLLPLSSEPVILAVSDGTATTLQSFILHYLRPPVITVVRPFGHAAELPSVEQELLLAVEVDGLGTAVDVAWSVHTAPGGATVTFSDPDGLETWAAFSHPGRHTLRIEADNGQGASYDLIDVFVETSGDTVLTQGLQGYWRMDETEGDTFADSSGNNRAATLNGNVNPIVPGISGNGMGQVGTSQSFVRVEYSQPQRFTVAGWFYATNSPANHLRTAWAFASGNNARFRMHFLSGSSRLRLQGNYNTNGIWETANDIPSLTWLHIAVTYDSTSVNNDPLMYVNGQPMPLVRLESPAGSLLSTNNFRIGSNGGGNSSWHGRIDEVRVYDRVVPAADIPLLMTVGSVNRAPDVTVGDGVVDTAVGQTVELTGAVSDDGLPAVPGDVETLWVEEDVPAPGQILAPMLPTSGYTASLVNGPHVLRLIADDGAAASSALLTVNVTGGQLEEPAITAQQQPLTVDEGQPASFSVTATGNPAPDFQWRKNGVNIDGATSATLDIPAAQLADAGEYDVVVSNSEGSVTSAAATLTVHVVPPSAPAITSHPQSQTVNQGQPASFSVSATGHPAPTYQWRKGGVNIEGATSATFTIAAAQLADAGDYDVVVTNSEGGATSNAATLTVQEGPTAPQITAQPQALTVAAGQPASFSVTATGNPAPSYQWRKGGVEISGATSATFEIPAVTASDAGSYDVVVGNSAGSVTSEAAVLTVLTPPQITTPLANQTVTEGATVVLGVTATGNPAPAFAWTKDGSPLAETGPTLDLGAVSLADAGTYAVTATNSAGSDSSSMVLTVNEFSPPPPGELLVYTGFESYPSSGSVNGTASPAAGDVGISDAGWVGDNWSWQGSGLSFTDVNGEVYGGGDRAMNYTGSLWQFRQVHVPVNEPMAETIYLRFLVHIRPQTGSRVVGAQFVINNNTNNSNNNYFPGFGVMVGGPDRTDGHHENNFFAASNSSGIGGTVPTSLFGGQIIDGVNLMVGRMTWDAENNRFSDLEVWANPVHGDHAAPGTSIDISGLNISSLNQIACRAGSTGGGTAPQVDELVIGKSWSDVVKGAAEPPPPPEPPPAPTGLAALALSSSAISLSWEDGSDTFRLERSLDGETWAVAATVEATTHGDTGLASHTWYSYRVIALRDGLESAPSAVTTARTWTVYEFPDDDGDGIDDTWEALHFPGGDMPTHLLRRGVGGGDTDSRHLYRRAQPRG